MTSGSPQSPAPLRGFARRLLAWFDREQRPLPWRKNRNPYRIWVSEVMLQQTQAATVSRFFAPFLRRFPTIRKLAAASEQAVLRAWEGLGYYRRARHLHQAAQRIVDVHGGRIPFDPVAMAALPGVGRYMTGAVLSQAFDARLPILEANSERVLSRILGEQSSLRSAPARERLWKAATALLPEKRSGDFNQALMELGATVCRQAPQCERCPVSRECAARKLGLEHAIPARKARPQTLRVREVAIVPKRGSRVWLCLRNSAGRWAGMWEFPRIELRPDEAPAAGSRRLSSMLGRSIAWSRELTVIHHTVTHHRIALWAFEASATAGEILLPSAYVEGRWVAVRLLQKYPISRPQRRIANLLTRAKVDVANGR